MRCRRRAAGGYRTGCALGAGHASAYVHVRLHAPELEGVEAYEFVVRDGSNRVLALSSRFMTYPPGVHSTYAAMRHEIARSRTTFVLLPSLDPEACVAETVRRQVARTLTRRTPSREEAVARERFAIYAALPAHKVETMRPPPDVAADIAARLGRASLA